MDPIITSALITGASSIFGNLFGSSSQNRANQISMDFQREMYERQRQDALEDWTRNATYNSPQEQMKRLKAAGLNPNLVYGGSNAIQMAQMPRGANAPTPNIKAPTFDFSMLAQIIPQMMQLKQTQAQTDNIKQQKEVIIQEAALKAAQTANAITQNQKIAADTLKSEADTQKSKVDAAQKAFTLGMAQQLKETSLQVAEQNLRKLSLENQERDFNVSIQPKRWEMEIAKNSASLAETTEKIIRSRAERGLIPLQKGEIENRIQLMKKDQDLKQLDIDLKKQGVQPHDAIYWRKIAQMMSKYVPEKEAELNERAVHMPWFRIFPY